MSDNPYRIGFGRGYPAAGRFLYPRLGAPQPRQPAFPGLVRGGPPPSVSFRDGARGPRMGAVLQRPRYDLVSVAGPHLQHPAPASRELSAGAEPCPQPPVPGPSCEASSGAGPCPQPAAPMPGPSRELASGAEPCPPPPVLGLASEVSSAAQPPAPVPEPPCDSPPEALRPLPPELINRIFQIDLDQPPPLHLLHFPEEEEAFQHSEHNQNEQASKSAEPPAAWVLITPFQLYDDVLNYIKIWRKRGLALPEIVIIEDYAEEYIHMCETVVEVKKPAFLLCFLYTNYTESAEEIQQVCMENNYLNFQILCPWEISRKNLEAMALRVEFHLQVSRLPISMNRLLVVGYDTNRSRRENFGACVVSMSAKMSITKASAIEYASAQDIIDHLTTNLRESVIAYKEKMGTLPDPVLVYRAGYEDEKINENIINLESAEVNKVLTGIYTDFQAKSAFISVTRRDSRSMYGDNGEFPGGGCKHKYQFNLVSEKVDTTYTVITDDIELTIEQMRLLTHKLSDFNFDRTLSVRTPVVCQLAHRLASCRSQRLEE